MVLIYTQKITPRITYTFRQVLCNILGLEIGFTSKVEEFIAHGGMKFSYGNKSLGNEIFVKAAGLLTEQGVSETEINVQQWEDVPCFYKVQENSELPFDIFSATFYMLSRYEEYLPYVKDDLGRYPAKESLAYKNKFLEKPVVDIWAYKFKKILQSRFPEAKFSSRKFKVKNILAIAEAYQYKKKGMMRNVGGSINDVLHFRIKSLYERFRTLFFLAKDPYDIYDDLLRFSKQHRISWEFMFQLSDYSLYNKNIGYNKLAYHILMKSLGDYGKIGLLLGYEALSDFQVLKKEKNRWERVVNRELDDVLSNTYGINLPELYNNYDELEIGKDYSMGFPERIGFRAGTCTPFLYYDLNFERISPLLLNPTVCHSGSFERSSFFEIKTKLERVKKNVKQVDGLLTLLFENLNFQDNESGKKVYQLLEQLNEE